MNRCWCNNEELGEYSNTYFKCSKCGSLVSKNEFTRDIVNVKDEDHDLYGVKYWEKGMLEKAAVSSLDELHIQYMTGRVPYWFQKLLEYIPLNDEMAEVGCGLGELSYVLQNAGCHITAYELSEDNCQYVRQKFGIDIKSEEFSQQQKGLGAIIAMDVYEHLLDPLVFLRNCRESLKEEGVLCIQTPCYNPELSFEQVVEADMNFKKLLVADEHIYLYSRQSIVKALEENGFFYHEFVPAFFGDDYDMFLFASAHEIKKNNSEQVKEFLAKTENEMLLRSWMDLFEQNSRVGLLNKQMAENTKQHLCDIDTLTVAVKQKEEYIKELEKNNKQQILDVETLTRQVKDKEDYLSELEQNNMLQIQNMEELNEKVCILQQGCDERLSAIEFLNKKLKETEEKLQMELERNIQAEQALNAEIVARDNQIKVLEEACEERLKNIMTLTDIINNMKKSND